jgi:hypothetical protein
VLFVGFVLFVGTNGGGGLLHSGFVEFELQNITVVVPFSPLVPLVPFKPFFPAGPTIEVPLAPVAPVSPLSPFSPFKPPDELQFIVTVPLLVCFFAANAVCGTLQFMITFVFAANAFVAAMEVINIVVAVMSNAIDSLVVVMITTFNLKNCN